MDSEIIFIDDAKEHLDFEKFFKKLNQIITIK